MKYRFDYIDEQISSWSYEMRTNADMIKGLPFGLVLPVCTSDYLMYVPFKDHYGAEILDMLEWIKERDEYCEQLAERNKYDK